MSARYKLIRDNLTLIYPEQRLEVCEDRNEIIKFGIKEIINQAMELEVEDFRNLDTISDMIELINNLYSIEPLGDAVLKDVEAVKRGRYLDFNVSVLNEGLIGIDEIELTIVADGEVVQVMDMGEIGIGYGRTLKASNVKLPSRNVDVIDFILDKDNNVRELNEDNNAISMVVESQ